MLVDVLSVEQIEQLRRSHATGGLTPRGVEELLAAAAQMARERRELARLLSDLPGTVTELRAALNRLSAIVR